MNPQQLDDFDLELVQRIRSMLWLGRRHRRSPGYYRDAGLALALLMGDRPRELWRRMVTEILGISVRRAYQLIEIARGRSLDGFRTSVAARTRKHRKDKWLPAKAPRQKGAKPA